MRATTKLRQLLTSTPLVVPGCYDAMSAKVLERAGFPAVYMTGYGTSLALLGLPDAGLATMSEMHLNARYIANAVGVPVIADADNGYGNAINVMRTVREYIQTGVAGIHIEDQAIPKRCGHVAGRRVIPIEEAVGKYRAAAAVRRDLDPDFVVIARTDARGAHGGSLDEAIRRANAYLEAGADLAFVEGPTSLEEVARVCREVRGPIFYNQTGVSPRLTPAQMKELGIAVTILPGRPSGTSRPTFGRRGRPPRPGSPSSSGITPSGISIPSRGSTRSGPGKPRTCPPKSSRSTRGRSGTSPRVAESASPHRGPCLIIDRREGR